MKIGLDLDGVVYNFPDAHRTYLVEQLHLGPRSAFPDPPQWNTWESWGLTFDEWRTTFEDGIAAGVIFGGGKRYLYADALWGARCLRSEGHEVHVITHRPETAENATREWLAEVAIPHTSLTFSADKTCVPVDVMIEDNVDNALACIAAGSVALLIDRPWNRSWELDGERKVVAYLPELRDGRLIRCYSWRQVVDEVCALAAAPNGEGTIVGGFLPPRGDEVDLVVELEDTTNPKDRIGLTKPPLDLLPAAALIYMSKVMALGAEKYGAYNWRTKQVRLTVYLAAAMRHILQALDGENTDPESGMPHMAHAMACLGIVLDALATGNLIDDRPTPGAAARLIGELTEVPA